jgi:pimeloyl-ACP methyl ester carboxylesterase
VRGCAVRYGLRPRADDLPREHPNTRTVLLVHGAAAHAGWWTEVAPLLTGCQVVVVDLSGHGDSGHREDYDGGEWAAEVAAVIGLTSDRPAVVVGHSMGGLVALAAAARSPELISSIVLVDTRLPLQRPLGLPSSTAPARLYTSADEALDRFRLLPAETTADPDLLREVARAGLTAVDGGWRWKYHPRARHRFTTETVLADIARVRCPVGYVYGARSTLGGPTSLAYLEQALGRPVAVRAVADAFHHVPLDHPIACADAVQALIDTLDQEELLGKSR